MQVVVDQATIPMGTRYGAGNVAHGFQPEWNGARRLNGFSEVFFG